MPVTEIENLASRISFGEVQAFRNLALVPLLDRSRGPAGYLALDEALRRGQTEITEVSESGSVPQLKLRNRGPKEVFLLDGEELVGAKQNRILNLSILIPGHTELEIPVSCVEQGRWSWRGRGFRGSDRVIFSKLRRSNAESVSANLAEQNSRASDQRGVWKSVSDKAKRMSVHSDTGAASALFERYRQDLDEFVSELKPVPGQVGAAFLVNGQFAGLDILAGPDLLARLLPKLVRSYALDAMDDEAMDDEANASTDGSTRSAVQSVERVIAATGRMSAEAHPAIGRGQDLRLRGAGLVGAALTGDGTMIHLGIWSAAYR
jgi:hypothetical protein